MSSQFDVEFAQIGGVAVVRRKAIGDERGTFSRLFCDDTFAQLGLPMAVRQINHSMTARSGTIRGLHYQKPPYAEAKLVTCIKGQVFDVAIDLRQGSPTFLQHFGCILTAGDQQSLFLPPGCGHGFQALVDDCELLYLHSSPYRQEAEGGLNALDPALAIDWPLAVTEMSGRDRESALVTAAFEGLVL